MTEEEKAAMIATNQQKFAEHWGDDFTSMWAGNGFWIGVSPCGTFVGIEFHRATGETVRHSLSINQLGAFMDEIYLAAGTAMERSQKTVLEISKPEGRPN
ncbi:hypothetical protein AA309_26560 [Microvirga vignae]|uniref:Uncharacterized protein n=1 Tax=Microvirga vignae TaxID=1225564 RepID=A0A0H1R695_9HYPH|nr:hypothetical protein [Microvirga vignae]KLK90296.1 hypothetical protein AA309_26560 [Microvirga vignae]